jgi:hypothetical protein
MATATVREARVIKNRHIPGRGRVAIQTLTGIMTRRHSVAGEAVRIARVLEFDTSSPGSRIITVAGATLTGIMPDRHSVLVTRDTLCKSDMWQPRVAPIIHMMAG